MSFIKLTRRSERDEWFPVLVNPTYVVRFSPREGIGSNVVMTDATFIVIESPDEIMALLLADTSPPVTTDTEE